MKLVPSFLHSPMITPLGCSRLSGTLRPRPSHSRHVVNTLQAETFKVLEWSSVCDQLSPFTSTSMGLAATRSARIPMGQTFQETQRLLDLTSAAVAAMEAMGWRRLDLSEIEDISVLLDSASKGQLLTAKELCAVRRTLMAVRAAKEKLEETAHMTGDSGHRYGPVLEIFQTCNVQSELEQKIGFCIDCNLSTILDRASEDLELIRAERKKNSENLDSLLKKVSTQIYLGGGIDKPVVTQRRSRFCVGIRASHKYLFPDGIILGTSSSGATYFMEPKEAVELNNREVRLANSEKAEETAILSLLTSEVAESGAEILYILDRISEIDLAFARASWARWMNGVCPILVPTGSDSCNSDGTGHALMVDIEGIRHPLLLGSTLRETTQQGSENHVITCGIPSNIGFNSPVPIDIKVECGTTVIVISGPNTGGKTASLKTLGLASLMSKSGMFLPAIKQPRLPWFDHVLAAIGDHQSLEQNLSTFSGQIARISKIIEVASEKSLVLIDEICNGTDPSEGKALSASILQYLRDRVKLTVVTTHYADLSRQKDMDHRFQNAAMEFSPDTLQPTYRLLWGSSGDSNALRIARSIGFDSKIVERAEEWAEKLNPEEQQEQRGLLYQSLLEERQGMEVQTAKAASLHSSIVDLYHKKILLRDFMKLAGEAEDLDHREMALMEKEAQKVQEEVNAVKSQINSTLEEFTNQLKNCSADNYSLLLRNAESAMASIVEPHRSNESLYANRTPTVYEPQAGMQVFVKGLGDRLATVVELPADKDDDTILVQYGKVKMHVKKGDLRPAQRSEGKSRGARLKKQVPKIENGLKSVEVSGDALYGPVIQTSRNSVDLRGLRVEEAIHQLNMAIAGRESRSVLFVIHGMGTGAVKECALEILKKHPRVARYQQESPTNYGCTVAFIN